MDGSGATQIKSHLFVSVACITNIPSYQLMPLTNLALLVTDVTSVNFCDQQMRHTVTHNSRLPNLLPAFHVTQEQIFWRRCLVLILTNNKLNIKHRA